MKLFRIDCKHFCCCADVDDNGIIRECAPIIKGFRNKPLNVLINYYSKKGLLNSVEEIKISD